MTRMSGPGDIDGEVSGDEAAWRDLVARFDSPAEQADASSPWPARENIPDPAPKADPVDTQDLPGPLVAGTIQPLPPPRTLDPIAKAAWLGVIAGPGYLLLASLIMHWTISATEAFVAVAAFIGGFVTLVIKLGDHPRDDDDNGAVL
jgi:hypothetical protein